MFPMLMVVGVLALLRQEPGDTSDMLVTLLVGAIVGPIVTMILKKMPSWEELGAVLNLVATMLLFIAWWKFVKGGERELLEQYLLMGAAAAGLGNAGNNLWRKKMAPEAPID